MHPRPIAPTSGPLAPSFRFCMVAPFREVIDSPVTSTVAWLRSYDKEPLTQVLPLPRWSAGGRMKLSADRREEIASSLRLRLARLSPGDVGLPPGRRRRTPGLRREEVAALAGVSTEWYKWLEQARAVRPSMETMRRIAEALRCEPGETRHLLTLAGYGEPHVPAVAEGEAVVSEHLMRMLAELDPCPAWVHGERWDFLAWNRAATVIHGDLASRRGIERNGMYQFFLGTRMRSTLVDWERHARGLVGTLRLAHGRYVGD